MARCHLFRPLTDAEGNLVLDCTVTLYMSDAVAVITQVIYTTSDGSDVYENPFNVTSGFLDIWLDHPQRLYVHVASPGFDEVDLYLKLDVLPPAPEIVTVRGGILKIINVPNPGDVLFAADTEGEAEWRPVPVGD